MTNLLDLLFRSSISKGANWYTSTFIEGLDQIPQAILSFIISYLVIQFFFFIIPPLKRMMMVLGAPFRYMHVWLHIDMARRIETKKYGINNKELQSIGFWGENKGNDMVPLLHTRFSTYDAIKIASAPLWGAFALFFFLIISSPIFAGLGFVGVITHIYLLFCCFGIAFPSLKDYSFLVKGTSIQPTSLSPGYILWSYFIFAISGYITLERTSSAMEAVRDATFYVIIYIFLLLVISRVGKRKSLMG